MNLYVTTVGARVGVNGGRLEISQNNVKLADYPLNRIDCITLYPGVNLTPGVIKEFSEKGKGVFWINSIGKTYGCLSTPGSGNFVRRKQQYLLTDNELFTLEMAKKFISGKISNQITVLRKMELTPKVNSTIGELVILNSRLRTAESIEKVMGIEGIAARDYFATIATQLPDEFGFVRRTRQPPKDRFSALISFLYTLIHNDCVTALQGAGLDPNVGIMHALKNGHYALASDIMEEFRPVLGDNLALHLIRSKIIGYDDFDEMESGAVYLKTISSKKVIEAYLKLLSEPSLVKKKKGYGQDWRSMIIIQVNELVAGLEHCEPKEYIPAIAA